MMIRYGMGVADETGADPAAELAHLLAVQAALAQQMASPEGLEQSARITGWQQGAYMAQVIYNWLLALQASATGLNSTQQTYLNNTVEGWRQKLANQKAGAAAEVSQYGQGISDAGARLIAKDIAPGSDVHSLSWNIADVERGIQAILNSYIDPSVKTNSDAAAAQQAQWIDAQGAATRAAIANGTYYSQLNIPLQFIPQQFGGTMPPATTIPITTQPQNTTPATTQQQTAGGAGLPASLTGELGTTGIPMWAALGGGFMVLMLVMGGGRR